MSNLSMVSTNQTFAVGLRVMPSIEDDRRGIFDILLNSGIFNRGDAECVDGMFSEAFSRPGDDNYRFLSCWEDGDWPGEFDERTTSGDLVRNGSRLAGFACYGREALTQGTWDLFWVCVSSAARRKGAGRALLADVLQRAQQERVRLIVIYTSSTDRYAPARRLYESMGFVRTATVPNYYAENDDLFIYTQRLASKE